MVDGKCYLVDMTQILSQTETVLIGISHFRGTQYIDFATFA